MQQHPAFELFEDICEELGNSDNAVIIDTAIDDTLMQALRDEFRETTSCKAYDRALEFLEAHFADRRSKLPFSFVKSTREFSVTDQAYLDFVINAKLRRGLGGKDAKEFEEALFHRIQRRVTGSLRRVGAPRAKCKSTAELSQYLCSIGFAKRSIRGKDKDGGFDILWLPPLGTVPLRPVASLQCKNGFFSEDDANSSIGRANRTLDRRSHIKSGNRLLYVVFNDYFDARYLENAEGWQFIPLGLSDFADADDDVVEML